MSSRTDDILFARFPIITKSPKFGNDAISKMHPINDLDRLIIELLFHHQSVLGPLRPWFNGSVESAKGSALSNGLLRDDGFEVETFGSIAYGTSATSAPPSDPYTKGSCLFLVIFKTSSLT